MPVIYAFTKKAELKSWLKEQKSWMTKAEIRRMFFADTGTKISASSVSAAIEEWQMNNYVTQQDNRFCWTWGTGKERQGSTSAQARYRANHPDRVAATAKKVEGKTIKRASVRFMVDRDEGIFQWLEDNYGGSGGPEILKALRNLYGKND